MVGERRRAGLGEEESLVELRVGPMRPASLTCGSVASCDARRAEGAVSRPSSASLRSCRSLSLSVRNSSSCSSWSVRRRLARSLTALPLRRL